MKDKSRTITLSDGTTAKIDDRDWRRVTAFRWRTHAKGVITETGRRSKRRYQLLHRLVARAKPGEVVIFRNGDYRDCKRSNLIVMTKGDHNRSAHRKRSPRAAQYCGGWWPIRHNNGRKIYDYFRACFRGRYKYFKSGDAADEWVQGQRARDGRPIAVDAVTAIHGEGTRLDWSDRSMLCASFAQKEVA